MISLESIPELFFQLEKDENIDKRTWIVQRTVAHATAMHTYNTCNCALVWTV